MRRLILTITTAALVAGAPLASAWALDGDRGRGRGAEQRSDRGGPRFERPRGGDERRFERPRRDERRFERPREDDRRFDRPREFRAEPPRQLRPGGQLPGAYREGRVEDYGRYRLRPPPRGFAWYRAGEGFLLVSPDGQIFDMVVD